MELTQKTVVMVAVDFTECGDDALNIGLTMLQDGGASMLRLLHVLDPRDMLDAPENPASAEEGLSLARRVMLERAHGMVFLDDSKHKLLKAHARIGRPVPTIVQACVDYGTDLLIVGTHARRGVERLLLGSVAEALVREAPCPVLIARPVDYAARSKSTTPDEGCAPGKPPAPSAVEPTISAATDSWRPSDKTPTGFRPL